MFSWIVTREMNSTTFHFLFWFLVCSSAIIFTDGLKSGNSARIVGGDKVPEGSGKWPFIIALLALNTNTSIYEPFCGGTIVNDDTILTAAHCLMKIKPADIIGFAGHENILHQSNERNQLDLASKFIIHSRYMPGYSKNDIAIIKLKWRLDYNKIGKVGEVCLPNSMDYSLIDPKHCYAIGWGRNLTNGTVTDILHQVQLSLFDDDACTALEWDYRPYTASVMLCAGHLKGGKGPCMGDSGGPLVCPLKSDPNSYVQHGIASFQDVTKGCASPLTPSYYTKVAHYLDWIQNIAKIKHDEL